MTHKGGGVGHTGTGPASFRNAQKFKIHEGADTPPIVNLSPCARMMVRVELTITVQGNSTHDVQVRLDTDAGTVVIPVNVDGQIVVEVEPGKLPEPKSFR